jgi:hypothetical protein
MLPGWLNKVHLTVLRLLGRPLKDNPLVAYCCVYEVAPTFLACPAAKPDSFPGLIAWHVLQDGACPEFVCYWRSASHYLASRTHLERELALPAPLRQGSVGDWRCAGPTWWPSSPKEGLVAAAAVFGAVTALWDGGRAVLEPMFAAQKVALTFAETETNLHEDEPARIKASVHNETPFVSVQVAGIATLGGAAGPPVNLSLDPPAYWSVDPDTSEPFEIPLTAPHLASRHAPSSLYHLSVDVSARATRIRAPFKQQFPHPVRIWPRTYGWTPELKHLQADERIFNARGTLYSGQAYAQGLRGSVQMTAPAALAAQLEIDVQDLQHRFRLEPAVVSPPDESIVTIARDFTTPPLAQFGELPFLVSITSSGAGAQWDAIEKSIQVRFKEKQ